jgi:hypothetical protein
MKDLEGYIRQSTAANRYGLSSAALTLRRQRSPEKLKTIVHDGAVFVFEADVRDFAKDTPGPKPKGKKARKKTKVA